jgi:hypothetical protein
MMMLSDDLISIDPRVDVKLRATVKEVLKILKSVAACMAPPTVAAAELTAMSPAEVSVPVPE